ncbi:MAG: 2Fe-2S iron-sulfur cluster-binding protein [Bilophila wadsworthia]
MPCNRQSCSQRTHIPLRSCQRRRRDVPKLPVDYRQPRNHHHSGRSAANPEGTGSSISFRFACRVNMCGSCGMVINGREGWPVRPTSVIFPPIRT